MSFLDKALRSGAAVKALEIAKREAAKPENQRKARELLQRLRDRQAHRRR
ncbi:MAG: hypothetical protein ACLGIA_09130 [Actinomycetes bacterium]